MEEQQIDLNEPIELQETYFLTPEDKVSLIGKHTEIVIIEIKKLDFGLTAVFMYNNAVKYWVLKKKNLQALIAKFGPKPKDWIGQKITLEASLFHKAGLNDGVEVKII